MTAPACDYDLLIRAGRLFCAATGLDGPGAVAVRGDRIVAAGPDVAGTARETLDFPDDLLLPGLVDLHTHPGPADWKFGIDADRSMLARGSTTVLSQGDAGAVTWPQYQAEIIAPAQTRIRLAINLARLGESRPGPCFQRADDVDVDACVAAIEAGGEAIWGIALNLSTAGCVGLDPRDVLRRRDHGRRAHQPALALRPAARDDRLAALVAGRPAKTTTAARRRGNLLLPSRYRRRRWLHRAGRPGARRGQGSARARHPVRRGAWHGLARLRRGRGGTGRRLPPRHDLHRCLPAPSRRRSPTRPPAHDLQADRRRHGRDRRVGALPPRVPPPRWASPAKSARWHRAPAPTSPSCASTDAALPLADVGGATRPGGCWEPLLTVRAGQVV